MSISLFYFLLHLDPYVHRPLLSPLLFSTFLGSHHLPHFFYLLRFLGFSSLTFHFPINTLPQLTEYTALLTRTRDNQQTLVKHGAQG